MHLLFKNRIYRYLTISRFFNSIGSALYNIVFIVYAANCFHSNLMVGLANIVMVIPSLFTVFVGIRADNTIDKKKYLILSGFIQAILFTFVALIINQATLLIFSIVSFVNISSDILSDYSNGLKMPMIQKYVNQNDLMEAYSFTQLITFICNLSGQALGVWLLTFSNNNFSQVAFINALSFLIAVGLIFPIVKELDLNKVSKESHQSKALIKEIIPIFTQIKQLFNQSTGLNFVHLLVAVLLLNSLGGSTTAIYNIFLLKEELFNMSYSQSLLVVETVTVSGILLASLSPHDYFSQLAIDQLLRLTATTFILMGLANFLHFPLIVGLCFLGFAAYLAGKINPKINALLMSRVPSQFLARTSNFLSLLFTLSIPLGTAIYSLLATWNLTMTWLLFTSTGILVSLLSISKGQ
ncbi:MULTISPECIES: MFS transporter [Aerococcus]|uniref:transporter n=1 Tax=Aerococcus urinae (strain CCUG 59500 / ACS-120-V-Col10a) TaxID=2976812 RepID=UPI0003095834|nr:transporter [Aerococcus sp. Group 1]MCY3031136.1 transporter [Aerococcus sp. Group 1]MCY3054228.1 transporter [Aerococcus sp. Group 1]MCY3055958.1 transporter [Aerococcus sp. Group 1]MCY3061896.1 transporter [Aerococcus sp. Group 1]